MDRLEYAADHARGVASNWLWTWAATAVGWASMVWSRLPLPLIVVMILIVVDHILAMWAAKRSGVFCWGVLRQKFIGKTGYKAIVLAAANSLAVGNPFMDGFSAFIVGGIGVLEAKSIIRHADAMTGGKNGFWSWLRRHADAFDVRTTLKGLAAAQKRATPLEVEQDEQDQSVIRLHGCIDASNVEPIQEAAKDALDRHGRVTFDVSDVQFIDSTGFAFLLTAIKHAVVNGLTRGDIIFQDPNHKTFRTLTLMGLDQLVNVKFTPPSSDPAIPADAP